MADTHQATAPPSAWSSARGARLPDRVDRDAGGECRRLDGQRRHRLVDDHARSVADLGVAGRGRHRAADVPVRASRRRARRHRRPAQAPHHRADLHAGGDDLAVRAHGDGSDHADHAPHSDLRAGGGLRVRDAGLSRGAAGARAQERARTGARAQRPGHQHLARDRPRARRPGDRRRRRERDLLHQCDYVLCRDLRLCQLAAARAQKSSAGRALHRRHPQRLAVYPRGARAQGHAGACRDVLPVRELLLGAAAADRARPARRRGARLRRAVRLYRRGRRRRRAGAARDPRPHLARLVCARRRSRHRRRDRRRWRSRNRSRWRYRSC